MFLPWNKLILPTKKVRTIGHPVNTIKLIGKVLTIYSCDMVYHNFLSSNFFDSRFFQAELRYSLSHFYKSLTWAYNLLSKPKPINSLTQIGLSILRKITFIKEMCIMRLMAYVNHVINSFSYCNHDIYASWETKPGNLPWRCRYVKYKKICKGQCKKYIKFTRSIGGFKNFWVACSQLAPSLSPCTSTIW